MHIKTSFKISGMDCQEGDTVDGWNPAPPGMYETLQIIG